MNIEKILVTGASGMVGSHFVEISSRREKLLTPDEKELDLTDPQSLADYFSDHPEIDVVINFAAYTNVSEGQKQKGDESSPCYRINVVGVKNLIDHLVDTSIYLIHISTDMVFSGDAADPGPYAEDHPLEPDQNRLTWYGHTKALAEREVGRLPTAAILRLIYPVVAAYDLKPDYLRSPLAYYKKNGALYPIFTDQQMNITDVDEICQTLDRLLTTRPAGIFHAASADITTPYAIMCTLFDQVYGHHQIVKPGSLDEFLKTAADPTRYPKFGGLLVKKTETALGVRYSDSASIVKKLHHPKQ